MRRGDRLWRVLWLAPLVSFGVVNFFTQQGYVTYYSTDPPVLRRNPDEPWLLAQLREAGAKIGNEGGLIDIANPALAKLLSSYARGEPLNYTLYPGHGIVPLSSPYKGLGRLGAFSKIRQSVDAEAEHIAAEYEARQRDLELAIWPNAPPDTVEIDPPQQGLPNPDTMLVSVGPRMSVLNASALAPNTNASVFATPFHEVRNHLAVAHSRLSNNYYYLAGTKLSDPNRVALFDLEHDPMIPGRYMSAAGQRILAQVFNPTPDARMVVEMSSTVLKEKRSALPQATVVGGTSTTLPMIGRGSARVFSDPVVPFEIAGRHYLGLDLGNTAVGIEQPRRMLMKLYGRNTRLDYRRIAAFVRDISLVRDGDLRARPAPAAVSAFPADLTDPGLEYSGFYEDGWTAEASFVTLSSAAATDDFTVSGQIPGFGDQVPVNLVVLANGVEVHRTTLMAGGFATTFPVSTSPGRVRIDLRFDHVQMLPDPDSRPISAQLGFIGWQAERIHRLGPSAGRRPIALQGAPKSDERADFTGFYADGWVAERASVTLAPNAHGGTFAIHGTVPMNGEAAQSVGMTVLVDGETVIQQSITPGPFEQRVALPPKTGPVTVELRFDNPLTLPASNRRRIGAHIDFLGWEPDHVSASH